MAGDLDIVFEDEYIVAFNKPAGLLSVPGRLPEHQDSLALRAMERWPDARVVHRLDCETSGLMIMALDAETHRRLNKLFHDRQVQKRYVAVGHGIFDEDEGSIKLPLIADWPNRPRQKVDFENGKKAHTDFRVLERTQETTRVRLLPITGRSHQLRVHMKELGHPILGDSLYAPQTIFEMAPRLLLHAEHLELVHPWREDVLSLSILADF